MNTRISPLKFFLDKARHNEFKLSYSKSNARANRSRKIDGRKEVNSNTELRISSFYIYYRVNR